jgi:hypothetical protein
MQWSTAQQVWGELDGNKQALMTRVERYASLTIPKLCLPGGFDVESTDQTHDYQSIGAQATNHLTNKVMLALFAPSRPFFRVDANKELREELAANGLEPNAIVAALGQVERDAAKELDARGQRPKLYTCVRHLIVTGNALLVLGKDSMRVMGLRYWCVKRNANGDVHTGIIKERVKFDELEPAVQKAVATPHHDATEVDHYRWITKDGGDYRMTQWVNDQKLPPQFDGKWPADKMPYRFLTWDLADESDYGTGLVEEYSGDFEAVSILSEAIVDGAVLGTEYRWLVDPTGMTSADDLNASENGDALPGKKDDVTPTQGGSPQAITVADNVLARYERRIALGFLMQSMVTRDAERVTAEEIRATAMELETAFGGVYSGLGNTIQLPVANWLLDAVGSSIAGTKLRLSIITGLDALSRNGDLENLRLALADLAQISALPPELQGRIKFKAIADYIGNGRGIDLAPFLKSEQEYEAYLQQMQAMRVQEANAQAAGKATAEATAQSGTTAQ